MMKEIIQRYFCGQTSTEEEELLSNWLKERPDNQEAFNKEYKLFLISQVIDIPIPKTTNARHRLLLTVIGFAAVIAIGIIAGIKISRKDVPQVIVSAEMGKVKDISLPDGTEVILNSGSSLEYPKSFDFGTRSVFLKGEAMFNVVSNPDHPFIVKTYAYDIKVTGTRFDVVADENVNDFQTALIEGKVEIQNQKGKTLTVLEANQGLELKGNKLVKSNIDSNDYLWTDGIISVDGTDFRNLMKKMSRCYGVNIVIDRSDDPVIHYDYLKLRVSDGFESSIKILQRRSDFICTLDPETNVYHIR